MTAYYVDKNTVDLTRLFKNVRMSFASNCLTWIQC